MKHTAGKLSGLKARAGQLVRLDCMMTMMGITGINVIFHLFLPYNLSHSISRFKLMTLKMAIYIHFNVMQDMHSFKTS